MNLQHTNAFSESSFKSVRCKIFQQFCLKNPLIQQAAVCSNDWLVTDSHCPKFFKVFFRNPFLAPVTQKTDWSAVFSQEHVENQYGGHSGSIQKNPRSKEQNESYFRKRCKFKLARWSTGTFGEGGWKAPSRIYQIGTQNLHNVFFSWKATTSF